MKEKISKPRKQAKGRRIHDLHAMANDYRLHMAVATLMDRQEDWDQAMRNPSAWLFGQGLELPDGFDVRLTRDLSISTPLDPDRFKLPDPDWNPYEVRFSNCRSFIVADKDEDGRITGYHLETVCFGFEIVMNRPPGPVGWEGPGLG